MILRRFKKTVWLSLFIFIGAQPAFALPSGQQVLEGTATFEQVDENTLNITASDRSIIEYQSFNIAENEIVNFLLPDASALSLNRILGVGATEILGSLTANGGIVLVNSNGFYFGSNALVEVQSAMISTHDIANADFLAGNYIFSGLGDIGQATQSSILNDGRILTYEEGFAILIADAIENRGSIEAPLGRVSLAAGDVVTVGISNDGLISVGVDAETAHEVLNKDGDVLKDQIKNSGTISAGSGRITLDADSMNNVFEKAINIEGIVRANQVEVGVDGSIEFNVDGADVINTGLMESDTGRIVIEAADEIIENIGTIRTRHFEERAYTFDTSGTIEGGDAFYDNLDGAATISGNIGSNQTDTGNIILTGGVTLTANNLIFTADSDNDNTGVFHANGNNIDGVASRNLTIISGGTAGLEAPLGGGESPTLGTFSNMGILTLNASTGNSPVYTASNNINDITNLSIGSGSTLYLNNFSIDLSAANTITNNGTIRLQGTESFGGNFGNDVTSGTFEFVGAAGNVVNILPDFGATDFFNLTINDVTAHTDAYTLTSGLTVAGALSVSGGSFSSANQTISVTGLTAISGSGSYGTGTSLNTLGGGLTMTGGTFTGGAGAIDINGDLSVSGATSSFTASSSNTNLSGDLTFDNSGTFNNNNGTFILDGGDQTLSGNISFNHLTKTVATTQTLTFEAGSLTTINGTMTLQGADASNRLKLRSSVFGTQYTLSPNSGRTVNFLDVQDSNNGNVLVVDCSVNCVGRGTTNTDWSFASTLPVDTGGGGGGGGSQSGSDSPAVQEESTRVVDLINQGVLPSSGPLGGAVEIEISSEGDVVAKPLDFSEQEPVISSDDSSASGPSSSQRTEGNETPSNDEPKEEVRQEDSVESEDSGDPEDPKGKDPQTKSSEVEENKNSPDFHWNFHDRNLASSGTTTVIVLEGAVFVQKFNEAGEVLGEGVYVRENEQSQGVGLGGVPEQARSLNLDKLEQAVGDRSTQIKGLIETLKRDSLGQKQNV